MKGQASALTQSATDAVKTQAGNLKESAKEVASDAGDKLRASVSEQKAAGADYVGNVANIIRRTAYEFDSDIPQAGHYIRKAAAQLENVSEAMRNRDMSEIVGNVQDFARKQPTAFFGAAVSARLCGGAFPEERHGRCRHRSATTTRQYRRHHRGHVSVMSDLRTDARSISRLLGDAFEQLSQLVQTEIRLARRNSPTRPRSAGTGVGMVFGGMLLMVPALVLFLIALAIFFTSGHVAGRGASALRCNRCCGQRRVDLLRPFAAQAVWHSLPDTTIRQVQKDIAAAKEMAR